MSKTPFTKLAASPEQLLAKWKSQGLALSDAEMPQALAYLRYVGAYRLKGYWFHLVGPTTKRFPAGYTFARIAERCEFDRDLRAATIEAIDRLEVAVRCVMGNYLSLKHSPHWLTVVRNVAAHHGQLLKVKQGVAPANYKVAGIRFSDQKAFFAAATVIHYLLDKTGLPHRWKEDLEQIFARHRGVDIADLGFPKSWRTSPGWASH